MEPFRKGKRPPFRRGFGKKRRRSSRPPVDRVSAEQVAIIGMDCRFPGANGPDDYWRNLSEGIESIRFYSPEELAGAGIDPAVLANPHFVPAGSLTEGAELFDASFFGINPREAESMDPQQRVFLECAWHALENAGYDPERYRGSIGVYAGCAMSTYFHQLLRNPGFLDLVGYLQALIGNDKDYLSTHVSYKLNLRGPSISVQSTCATSLVAICVACESICSGSCDMALGGGVCIRAPQITGYYYEPGGIYSPDGHCRVFDSNAQGIVFGNGVGVVVLKRLVDAVADGDSIYAVIKGWAINNDGASKASYTAPSVDGQADVIARAQAMAGVNPGTVTYVEAHGTATAAGDPVEIAGLTEGFRRGTKKKGFCAVGSVKSNFGHLDHAAGVAGLMKTVLALKHRQIPPTLHFEKPHPSIPFADSPFYVNQTLSEWKVRQFPRRAGVSAFGIGGTNAHVVLEEAPRRPSLASARPAHLLVLSAKTTKALEKATNHLAEHLKLYPHLNIADVAYTSQVGRKPFSHRRMLVCQSTEDAVKALESSDVTRVLSARGGIRNRHVVFLFSGQGTQYVNMARGLYRSESVFRNQVDKCATLLKPSLGLDLREVIYPPGERSAETAEHLTQTGLTQPALFVIEHALARLWIEWGVRPKAMIGHSIGEYVAACLAGVISLEDALRLVAARARLMQQLPVGAMLAVFLSEQNLQPYISDMLCLAAINEPSLCVVSGPLEIIDQLEAELAVEEIQCRRLHTSHAFHSSMMDPIVEPFIELISKVKLKRPRIPYVSNVTGTWITGREATSPRYWANHLRQTVRFSDGLQTLFKEPDLILLEVGPGLSLSTFARRHPGKSPQHIVLPSLRHVREPQPDLDFLLNKLGRLWLRGVPVNWTKFHAQEKRSRVPLPGYAFERQRYWIEATEHMTSTPANASQKKPDIADWFYTPAWEKAPPAQTLQSAAPTGQPSRWLIFEDAHGLGRRLAGALASKGADAVVVKEGNDFAQTGANAYEINPREVSQYHDLLKELCSSGKAPDKIIHLWCVAPGEPESPEVDKFDRFQDIGFYSLLYLAQAMIGQKMTAPVQIAAVTSETHLASGKEALCPAGATIAGPCKSIPQEYPNLRCRVIDIDFPENGIGWDDSAVSSLLGEVIGDPADTVIAYRNGERWVQTFERTRIEKPDETILREGGVYLITGGLGNICLALAEELARAVRAKLVLVGRSAFPARSEWATWLAAHGEADRVSRRIRKLQALEILGSEVMVCGADVTDEGQMQRVLDQARSRFGDIHGVIHGAGTIAPEAFFGVDLAKPEGCELHFQPKARGILVLERLLAGSDLDFVLLLSSLSSIVAGIGFVAYAAANAFLDAFAATRDRLRGTRWLSVNWDNWDFDENAVANGDAGVAMLPQEGVEAFRRILSQAGPRSVAVSTTDLQARIDEWVNFKSAAASEPGATVALHARPELGVEFVAARNETEQIIARIWQELLGIESIGVHDNFFELGGQSLLATQVVARVRTAFQTDLPLRRFFEGPTVAELALAVAPEATQLAGQVDAAPEQRAESFAV
jgi:acyl transferase domain-containing protein